MRGRSRDRIDDETHDCIFAGLRRKERAEAAAHRCRILEVARALFAECGVEAVSMHHIAQAAGVGQGTLYRRYAHKGELCLDLIQESGQRLYDEVETYIAASHGCPALERLDGVLALFVDFIEDKAHYLSAVADAACGERQGLQFKTPFYRWLHDTIESLLRQAVQDAEVTTLDAAFTADMILSALRPELYLYQRQECGMTAATIRAGLRRIYITGLHPAPGFVQAALGPQVRASGLRVVAWRTNGHCQLKVAGLDYAATMRRERQSSAFLWGSRRVICPTKGRRAVVWLAAQCPLVASIPLN